MSKFIFLFLSFFMGVASGQSVKNIQKNFKQEKIDILLQDPQLSEKYERGRYLVYDCEDQHWVCTGKFEYERCQESRSYSRGHNEAHFSCAFVKIYKNEALCIEKQRDFIHLNMATVFCVNHQFEPLL